MQTIDDYVEAAKKNLQITSDRELSRALGFAGPNVSNWRTKRAWPSDQSMVALADLAEMDVETALLELAIWRNMNTAAAPIYRHILEKLSTAALAITLIFGGQAGFGGQAEAAETLEITGKLSTPYSPNYILCDKSGGHIRRRLLAKLRQVLGKLTRRYRRTGLSQFYIQN